MGGSGTETAFEQAYERARALLGKAVRDDVCTRHQLGLLLRTIKNAGQTYGERAIERLAERLDLGSDFLYRCAAVAEQWSVADIERLSSQTNRRGEPLSWSHLVVLTRVPSAPRRRALAEEAIKASWSVRDLSEEVATGRASPAESSDQAAEGSRSVRLALKEGVQTASRATTHLNVFIEALEDRLDGASDDDEALFSSAIDAYENLQSKVEMALSRLRVARTSSCRRLRVAPVSPVGAKESPLATASAGGRRGNDGRLR